MVKEISLEKILVETANPKMLGFQGFSPECGYGLVDAEKTVKAAVALEAKRGPSSKN